MAGISRPRRISSTTECSQCEGIQAPDERDAATGPPPDGRGLASRLCGPTPSHLADTRHHGQCRMTSLPHQVRVTGLSGERITATYRIMGDVARAREVGTHITVEQTVEFPVDLLPIGDIPDHIVGRVTEVHAAGEHANDVTVTYAAEIAGSDLVQLLNVVFGNVSLLPGVRLVALGLPTVVSRYFRGPRFGVEGIRRRVHAPHRPLLSSALKPLGLGAKELAQIAGAFARGGVDLITDDQGLADQAFGRFDERVRACGAAVAEANAATGSHALYFANVTTRADLVMARAHEAKALGATGLLVCPALVGFDMIRALADDDELGLPLMAHPSFLGSHVAGPHSGIGHGLLFGTIQRLAGADVSVFPSFGGRFSFTRDECREIAAACLAPLGATRQALPAPGGGLTAQSLQAATDTYGVEAAYLVGGGLHRAGVAGQTQAGLESNARAFRRLIDGASEYRHLDRT